MDNMAGGKRWDVRPEQRSKDGLKGLARTNPPTLPDLHVDRIELTIKGTFALRGKEEDGPAQFDELIRLFTENETLWTAPARKASNSFTVKLRAADQWTISATMQAQLDKGRPELTVRPSLNPTRTLHHLLAELAHNDDPLAHLQNMSARDFFASSDCVQLLQSTDGGDNYLPDVGLAKARMDDDYFSQFLVIFDQQLRRWFGEAISPNATFSAEHLPRGIVSTSDVAEFSMDWPRLTVRSAEVFFERRHSGAPALMDRLTRKVLSAQSGAMWRSYGQNEVGERRPGTEVIGLELTANIQQKYYAKTASRVRCETRYTKGMRNVLREARGEGSEGAFLNIAQRLREDAKRRCQWDAFCNLCSEPTMATVHEAAALFATVAISASENDVDAASFLGSLLATGGIDLTGPDGDAPPDLINSLIKLGVLEAVKLQRRYRPGSVHRIALASAWRAVAETLQQAFAQAEAN